MSLNLNIPSAPDSEMQDISVLQHSKNASRILGEGFLKHMGARSNISYSDGTEFSGRLQKVTYPLFESAREHSGEGIHDHVPVLQRGALGLIGTHIKITQSDGAELEARVQGLRYPFSLENEEAFDISKMASFEAFLIQSGRREMHELLSPAVAEQSEENA